MKACFIDTNVIVYANDRDADDKHERAIEVIEKLMRKGNGVVSLQVIQEYANVALGKLGQDASVVMRQVKLLESIRMGFPADNSVCRQIEIKEAYGISFWDAGIIAAAEQSNCDVIMSEDLNSGQFYAGIEVVNPFKQGFDIKLYTD